MALRWQDWPAPVLAAMRRGVAIPAHPLALTAARKLDPRRQRALARYYLDAGAGGLAVGVHKPHFEPRGGGLPPPARAFPAQTARHGSKGAPDVRGGRGGRPARGG